MVSRPLANQSKSPFGIMHLLYGTKIIKNISHFQTTRKNFLHYFQILLKNFRMFVSLRLEIE